MSYQAGIEQQNEELQRKLSKLSSIIVVNICKVCTVNRNEVDVILLKAFFKGDIESSDTRNVWRTNNGNDILESKSLNIIARASKVTIENKTIWNITSSNCEKSVVIGEEEDAIQFLIHAFGFQDSDRIDDPVVNSINITLKEFSSAQMQKTLIDASMKNSNLGTVGLMPVNIDKFFVAVAPQTYNNIADNRNNNV